MCLSTMHMYKRSVIESHASDKELMNYILDFPLG
jgi:hypothetical protein